MLERLFDQYPLAAMLEALINASEPQSGWWVLDSTTQVLFQTVDRKPPADAHDWELKAGQYVGRLVTARDYPKVRALGDVMAQMLTVLLQNEAQRLAEETERLVAQQEGQIHQRLSQQFATLYKRGEVTRLALEESMVLLGAGGSIIYTKSSEEVFRLAGYSGSTPYGTTPDPELRRGLLHQVAQTQDTVWLNVIERSSGATATEQRARNILAIPLRFQAACVGVIALFNRVDGFNSRHVRLLQILATHAAVAYHHAARYRQLAAQGETDSDWQEVFEHSELDWKELRD